MIKRLLSTLIVLCLSLQLFAYDFSAVNSDGVTIYYNYTTPGNVEVASGSYNGVINIPSSVTYNGNTYSVTSIGDRAFQGSFSGSGLTDITIPNSIISIGDYAFFRCSSLTSFTIPNSVTSIGRSAFNCCYSLTNITIPNSITSIRDSTFLWLTRPCCSS